MIVWFRNMSEACYSCPCRGCPDGTVHIAMSQPEINLEQHLYMQMPNSQDFVHKFGTSISVDDNLIP